MPTTNQPWLPRGVRLPQSGSWTPCLTDSRRFNTKKYKTAMCKFFLQDKCLRWDRCFFAHSQDELRPPPRRG